MSDLKKLDGCINTFSGNKINLINPEVDQIDIIDIAKGLAYKGHFSGQTPRFFSIASHSTLVCDLCEKEHGDDPKIMLTALLHDASEAYIGDMVKPLKVHLDKFQQVEKKLQSKIFEAFDIDESLMKIVKPFDVKAQKIEYNDFYQESRYQEGKSKKTLMYLDPETSFAWFLNYFFEYFDKIKNNE